MTEETNSFKRARRRRLIAAWSFCSLAGATLPAAADGWHLDLEALTDVPLDLGARVSAETPFRLRLSTSVGWLADLYVDGINAVLVGARAYDQRSAALVARALNSPLVWRTHAGYRPFAGHGFYVDAGYGLVALGGAATTSTAVANAARLTAPVALVGYGRRVELSSLLHLFDLEVGWRWLILGRIVVRAGIGGAFTFAAWSSLVPKPTPTPSRLVTKFESDAASYLSDLYRHYFFTPTVTLAAGYQFF